MAQDSTRRLLKVFGIAVTNLEDALEAALAEGAKKAEAELRERMKEVIGPSGENGPYGMFVPGSKHPPNLNPGGCGVESTARNSQKQ